VVSVKMTDSYDPKRLDSKFRLFEIDLTSFSGIENVEMASESHRKGGEIPIR
jgi:hypothetical protein